MLLNVSFFCRMALFLVLTGSFNQAFSAFRTANGGRRAPVQKKAAQKRAGKQQRAQIGKERAAAAEAKRLAPEHNQLVVYTHPNGQRDVARDSGSAAATEAAKDAYRARVRANHPDKGANTAAKEQAATKISSLWRGYATRKNLKPASPAAAAWSSGPAPAAITPKRASSEAETIGKDYQRHLNTLSPERKAAVLKISRDAKNRDRKARVEKALAKKQAAQATAATQSAAATRIQALVRGRQARQDPSRKEGLKAREDFRKLSPEDQKAARQTRKDQKKANKQDRVEKALAKKQAAQAAQAAQAPAVADSKKWSTKKKLLVGTGAVLGAGALAGVSVGIGQLADKAETPDDPELVQQWQEQGEQEENSYGVATQTNED